MEELLFLAHRIPFPPRKGDKIRSHHVLSLLADRYRIHLGTFVDEPADWPHVDHVKRLCDETYFARLNRRWAAARSLAGLFRGQPLTLPYLRDRGLARWVADVLARRPVRAAFIFSSGMGQYVERMPNLRRVVDFVDVDSDKWRQYALSCKGARRRLFEREAEHLLAYERLLARSCDAVFFVSPAEAGLFRSLAPEVAAKIRYFNNGVDVVFFSPEHTCASPYPAGQLPIVFTGAMDYWPNVDAVDWFARAIFPTVKGVVPNAGFWIVGSNPAAGVRRLACLPGVHITGTVPDVRPFLRHARVAVAPMRVARGVQNKVLEAMAMGKATVVSPQALEGIDATAGRDLLLASTAQGFAEAIVQLLQQPRRDLEAAARTLVVQRYQWTQNLQRVLDALASPPPAAGPDDAPLRETPPLAA